MEPMKYSSHAFLFLSLILSGVELILAIILILKVRARSLPDLTGITDQLGNLGDALSSNMQFLRGDEHLSKLLVIYLILFACLSIGLLSSTLLDTSDKPKEKNNLGNFIVGTLTILKGMVYTFLLIYRYIASRGLEISIAITGFINSAVLLGFFCLKMFVVSTK